MVFTALNQSFAFHSSPESFISSRLQELAVSDPDLLASAAEKNKVVVASILNRKVHIVSSYQLCKDLLDLSSSPSPNNIAPKSVTAAAATSRFFKQDAPPQSLKADSILAGPAYHQLMADFFTPPNLLLEDGPAHASSKKAWIEQLATFPTDTTPHVRQIAQNYLSTHFRQSHASGADGKSIDLYQSLKSLCREVLLGIFLDLSPSNPAQESEYSHVDSLQESLLRGQFSLFPVSINSRLWQSPRSKGIEARKELQTKLAEIVNRQDATCPFLKKGQVTREDAARHAIMFTSSIAVKGMTSLLTAFVLNLFLWRDQSDGAKVDDSSNKGTNASASLADLIQSQDDPARQETMLSSVLSETKRLSPPVVGVMRRAQRPVNLDPEAHQHPHPTPATAPARTPNPTQTPPSARSAHTVPGGQDIWLYLSGASRDASHFGPDADLFRFDRYMSTSPSPTSPSPSTETTPPPLAFCTGPKTCLGTNLVRMIILTIGQVMLDQGIRLHGEVKDPGARIWLGWDSSTGVDGAGGAAAAATVAAEKVAKGLKQLPVQRPRESIRVTVSRT